ncbi:MAG: RluA family pseudouridine synthase [Defluviitaleaceae bacterium]|nr:RluA family pseudouridine synthase [Defluviitaleaceae bacterium]
MTLLITHENANRRLDKFLFAYFNNAPHSFIYKLLRKKRIKLNGMKATGSEILQSGDELKLYLSEETIQSCRKSKIFPKAKPLTDIIFEDENLLVINKPGGLPSQGGMSDPDHLLARIHFYLQEKGEISESFTPAICNRLDVNTSGLVICGKNLRTLQHINGLFAHRQIEKEYTAIAHGIVGKVGETVTLKGTYKKDSTTNTATIIKNNDGVDVVTTYTIQAISKNHTLLSIMPITGRSHQIRAHFASIMHPLLGDKKYGGQSTPFAPAQLLHCRRLTISQEQSWEAPLPKSFVKCIWEWFGKG